MNAVLYKYNTYWLFSIDIIDLDNLKLDIINKIQKQNHHFV